MRSTSLERVCSLLIILMGISPQIVAAPTASSAASVQWAAVRGLLGATPVSPDMMATLRLEREGEKDVLVYRTCDLSGKVLSRAPIRGHLAEDLAERSVQGLSFAPAPDGKVCLFAFGSPYDTKMLFYTLDPKKGEVSGPREVKEADYRVMGPFFAGVRGNRIIGIGNRFRSPSAMGSASTVRLVMDLEGNVLEMKEYVGFGFQTGFAVSVDEDGGIHLVHSCISAVDEANTVETSVEYVAIDPKGEIEEKVVVGRTHCMASPNLSAGITLDPAGKVHIYYTDPERVGTKVEWKLRHVEHKGKSPAKGVRLPIVVPTEGSVIFTVDKVGNQKEIRMPDWH